MTKSKDTIEKIRSNGTVKSIQSLKLKRDTKLTRTHVMLDIYKCDDVVLSKAKILEERVVKVLREYKMEPKIQTFYQNRLVTGN